MKVVQAGTSNSYTSADVKMMKAKKQNKFGTFYYFNEKILLIQNTPTTGYSTWKSVRDEMQLVLDYDVKLLTDLHALQAACKNLLPSLEFKELCCEGGSTVEKDSVGDYTSNRLFIKLNKKCQSIERDCGLKYVIQIYGVFVQGQTGKAFLQMELLETMVEKIS